MDSKFKSRQRIAVVACVMALIVLIFYTRCADNRSPTIGAPPPPGTATGLSDDRIALSEKEDGLPHRGLFRPL